jgi:hypothetical protein
LAVAVCLTGCTGVGAAYPYEAQLKRVDTEAIVKAGSPDFVDVKLTVTLTEAVDVDIMLIAGTGSPTVANVCKAFDAAATAMPFTPDTVQARGTTKGAGVVTEVDGLGAALGSGTDKGFRGTWDDFRSALSACHDANPR